MHRCQRELARPRAPDPTVVSLSHLPQLMIICGRRSTTTPASRVSLKRYRGLDARCVALAFNGIDPIKALYWADVINGVISVPIMSVMMRMVANPKIMGELVVGRRLTLLGWLATSVMALAVSTMFVQMAS
jgi:Mn2+/Fe2+ NRAMP family transporter